MEAKMRKLALLGLLAVTPLLDASPSLAYYEGPWCLRANVGRSMAERCHFRTFEACRTERSFYGSTSFCSQNPRYLPYWSARFAPDQRRKDYRWN